MQRRDQAADGSDARSVSPLQLLMTAIPSIAADLAFFSDVLGARRSAHVVRASELATGQPCEVKVYDLRRAVAHNELAHVRGGLKMQWRCQCPRVMGILGRWLILAWPMRVDKFMFAQGSVWCAPTSLVVNPLTACPRNAPAVRMLNLAVHVAGAGAGRDCAAFAVGGGAGGGDHRGLSAATEQQPAVEAAVARRVCDMARALHHLQVSCGVVHRCASAPTLMPACTPHAPASRCSRWYTCAGTCGSAPHCRGRTAMCACAVSATPRAPITLQRSAVSAAAPTTALAMGQSADDTSDDDALCMGS